MGTCKYCGQSAGFFSKVHKECEEKHSKGISGMAGMMHRYFSGAVTAKELQQRISRNRVPYFLSDEDIVDAAISALTAYGETLRRPYGTDVLPRIKEFLACIGQPYASLNRNGALDRLGQKLFQGYLVDFFARGVLLSQITVSTNSVTSVLPLNQEKKNEAYYSVLNKAADKFMTDGTLSDQEQQLIESYISSLGISLNNIPAQYYSESLGRIGQAIVLKDLQQGTLPKKPLTVPVMLGKGESALWVYHNVTMYQERFQREYQGRTGGFSYRVCKGVTYRTGQFRGKPVEKSYMDMIGVGSLVVTNKNLFFHCPTASVKIPYTKVVGMTPYSDGLEVHKEEAKPKRTVFEGFDAWFIMNVINLLN